MPVRMPSHRWRRRGKIAAAFLAVSLGINNQTHHALARIIPEKSIPTNVKVEEAKPVVKSPTRPVMSKPAPVKSVRKEIPIPTELPTFASIPKKGSWCSRYVRLYAEKMYGIKYHAGNAWDLAARNRSVWKIETTDRRAGNPNKDYLKHVKQGYVLGIYYPSSGSNRSNRPYTHVVTFDGMHNGKAVVTNHISGKTTRENLDDLLARLSHPSKRNHDGKKAAVIEVIAPRRNSVINKP